MLIFWRVIHVWYTGVHWLYNRSLWLNQNCCFLKSKLPQTHELTDSPRTPGTPTRDVWIRFLRITGRLGMFQIRWKHPEHSARMAIILALTMFSMFLGHWQNDLDVFGISLLSYKLYTKFCWFWLVWKPQDILNCCWSLPFFFSQRGHFFSGGGNLLRGEPRRLWSVGQFMCFYIILWVCPTIEYNVGKTTINHPFGNCL
jgi:hypothetical protein